MRVSKKWRICLILLVALLLLAGALAVAYPMLSSQYAAAVRSTVHSAYLQAVDKTDTGEIDAIRAAAQAYNRRYAAHELDPLTPRENGYYEQLCLPHTDIMGYIRIPGIGVELPIYHGADDTAMHNGVGHMAQSSLPIGGESTHSVLSAHTGMAGSPMFSDLELLTVGDMFYIDILGETLAYEVDRIDVVLPSEIGGTKIVPGEDYCTLVTCTPFGVNTHRLLVRGRRTAAVEAAPDETDAAAEPEVPKESVWLREYRQSVLIAGAICLCAICLAAAAVIRRRRKGGEDAK